MPRRKQDTLPGIDLLPGDKLDKDGKRRAGSRWTRFRQSVAVEQQDIDRAMRKNSHACMIAEAIKRRFPEFKGVTVEITTIRFTDPEKQRRVICLTPLRAQHALVAFDRGIRPKPFTFDLRSAQITQAKGRKKIEGAIEPRFDATNKKTRAPSHKGQHVVGGAPPPVHRASRHRTFGIKGFTWDDVIEAGEQTSPPSEA